MRPDVEDAQPVSENEDLADAKLKEYETLVNRLFKNQTPLSTQESEIFDRLVSDLDVEDDPVYRNCCLQMVADLGPLDFAINLLEQKQVPKKLVDLLDQGNPLIVPHAMKFFYNITPITLETRYMHALDKVCNYCVINCPQLFEYAVDFFTVLGRHGYLARRVLDKQSIFKSKCLPKLGSTLKCSESLLKCRTLACIKELLALHEDDPIEPSTNLSNSFYHSIIEGEHEMTKQLSVLCQVPFPEIRAAAKEVIETVENQPWAVEELANFPDLKRGSQQDRVIADSGE